MRRLIWLTASLSLVCQLAPASAAVSCDAANPDQVRLQISVSGMHTTKGRITISIYPDVAAEFLHGRYKLGQQHVPVVLPVTHACFVVPTPGDYAVALFGDEKNNNHFEVTALGLPAEGYGFSDNPRLYFGPPGLGRVRFPAHPGDNQVTVRMQYYP
jgi:uncharacterized protein (DUF2141 family)